MMATENLREHTTVPLTNTRLRGFDEESPEDLGPMIVMDFINGTDLDELLKRPAENNQQDVILDRNIDEAKLDVVYYQVAEYMLQPFGRTCDLRLDQSHHLLPCSSLAGAVGMRHRWLVEEADACVPEAPSREKEKESCIRR